MVLSSLLPLQDTAKGWNLCNTGRKTEWGLLAPLAIKAMRP